MNTAPTARRNRQAGVTLIESLIVVAVSIVVVGVAVPSFGSAHERRQLEGTAAQLETDLQYARSLAVAANRTLRFSVGSNAAGSCYTISDARTTDAACLHDGHRKVQLPPDRLRLSASAGSMAFDPVKGTVTPTSTVELRSNSGHAVRVIVNVMGRVRSCSPTGLPGFKPC